MARSALSIVVLASLACQPALSQGPPTQDDFADVAAKVAPTIAQKISAKHQGAALRVAVFPFGNAKGSVTIESFEPTAILQGELIEALITKAKGKYLVLHKAGLQREFQEAGVDPSAVRPADAKATAELLRKVKINVAVVGAIDATSRQQIVKDQLTKINVLVTVIFDDGTAEQLTGNASPNFFPPPTTNFVSDRFKVEFFLNKDDRPLPLVTSKDPDSKYHKVYFLEVPKDVKLGTEEAEFYIKITNNGKRPFFKNPQDEKRLWGVALLVDGVNSIFQKTGDDKTGEAVLGPVVVHPRNAAKWVLTGPGDALKPDKTKKDGYTLISGNGNVVKIPGFQSSQKKAYNFRFGPARESIAESVGITNEVGMIALHFYPQKLEGDEKPVAEIIGVGKGREVENPTFRVHIDLEDFPIEVWRIFYRSAGECPIPPEQQTAAPVLTKN